MAVPASFRKDMRALPIATSDEEARAYLQTRLVVMSKLMFWSFVTLLGFMGVVFKVFPEKEPRLNWLVYTISGIGLTQLAMIWRLLLVRRLSITQLRAIDVYFLLGTGLIFAASGTLAYDLRPSAYICLTYACLLVLLRATVVPSTGTRTAVISILTCLPMTAGTVALVYLNQQDIPGPAYVGGGILICTMAILLATVGSNILYTLRRQVRATMQLGQYTLGRKIGGGGNGAVFKAHHALLRRPTALKVVRPEYVDAETLDRFENEVQHMSQLTHPNTVAVFDYGRSPDGIFYYVMEYLDGIDLEKLVARFGAQPADRVVPILIQVCGSLAEAHRRGIVHRDIKPANIILSERGDVPDVAKVVDFGLVAQYVASSRTETRGLMGTPAYIAPELVTDPQRVGPRSDLYALGAVGYYLLTGKRVFEGATAVDVCVQHVTAPAPRVAQSSPQIPALLDELIACCLAKQPEARPESASRLANLLEGVPIGDGWTDDEAVRWWREFRASSEELDEPSVTQTITVDLQRVSPTP